MIGGSLKTMILIKRLKKINREMMILLAASEEVIKELYKIEKPENLYDPEIDSEGMPKIDP